MADVNATELTTKTTPAGTDDVILFGQNTNVGYKIDYDDFKSAVLDPNNMNRKTLANISVLDKTIVPGVYYVVNATDVPNATTGAGWLEIAERAGFPKLRKVYYSHYGSSATYLNQTDATTGEFIGWVQLPTREEMTTRNLNFAEDSSKMTNNGSVVLRCGRVITLFLNGTITAGATGGDFVSLGSFTGDSSLGDRYYYNSQVTQNGTPILFRFNAKTGDVGYYCATSPSGMMRATITVVV